MDNGTLTVWSFVLSIFGDESSDETKRRVFVVAGLLGDTLQWHALEQTWSDRTDGKVFHAADCESRRGEFRDMPIDECHRLHRDLTRILADSRVIGWAAGIDLAAAKRLFVDLLPHQPYLSCFLRVIHELTDQANRCIPRHSVKFIFDRHPETEYNSGLLYQYVKTEWVAEAEFLAEDMTFASRKFVGIQAADLWAREFMKRFDSYIQDDRSIPRPQWHTLRSTNRFAGEFVCHEYFEDLKARFETLSASLGMKQDEYDAWLKRKRRQDNQSNRIAYMMEVDAADRAANVKEAS